MTELDPVLLFAAVVLLGICVGSFLNVVIHRLPGMIVRPDDADGAHPGTSPNLLTPPSSCPQCGTHLRIRENIPIVSYLWLRGKCAHCGTTISPRYPLVELLTAAVFVFVFSTTEGSLAIFGALLFSCCVLALLFIDLEHKLLPDAITLPLLWCGLLINIPSTFVDLPSAVIGAVAGYLALWSVYHVFLLLTGKEGLGYGDFKLVAAIGAWLGWQLLPLVILLGSTIGAVVGGIYLFASKHGRDHQIPFGPFLAGAGWVAMFWGHEIVDGYLQMTGFQ